MRSRHLIGLLSVISIVACAPAAAQSYPAKPIRFVVPFAEVDAPASSEQGSLLRDAIVRESAVGTVKVSMGVASVFGVTSPKGAPAPPYDGVPGLVSRRPVRGQGAQASGFHAAAMTVPVSYPTKPIRFVSSVFSWTE